MNFPMTHIKINDVPESVPIIVSYGGGKNSTALLLAMLAKGIKPNAIVFADTGNEKPETYKFIEWFSEWLIDQGFPEITVVRYYLKGSNRARRRVALNIPEFLFNPSNVSSLFLELLTFHIFRQTYQYTNLGEESLIIGGLPGAAYGLHNCSLKWKIDPYERWVKENFDGLTQTWVGIHAGETKRLFTKKGEEKEHFMGGFGWKCYPLIDWNIDQKDCENLIAAYLPKSPPKSACWFCPYAKPAEVKELAEKYPEYYALGCAMEENAKTDKTSLGRGFSWRKVLDLPEYEQLQLDLFAETRSCTCIE